MSNGPLGTGTQRGGVTDAQYVTLIANATLTDERILTGTASRIVVTDGGAGAAVTLSPGALIVQTDQANTWTVGTQTIEMGAIGTTGLVAKTVNGATANPFEVQRYDGVVLSSIDASGGALFSTDVIVRSTVGVGYVCDRTGSSSSLSLSALNGSAGAQFQNNERFGWFASARADVLNTVVRAADAQPLAAYPLGQIRMGGYTATTGAATPTETVIINAHLASAPVLAVKAAAGQTANLQEWQDSAGTALMEVEASGELDFRWAMGNSTKDPTTDAPADWVQVKIGGTSYYLAAYAAS